jgi:hypothetical protein
MNLNMETCVSVCLYRYRKHMANVRGRIIGTQAGLDQAAFLEGVSDMLRRPEPISAATPSEFEEIISIINELTGRPNT